VLPRSPQRPHRSLAPARRGAPRRRDPSRGGRGRGAGGRSRADGRGLPLHRGGRGHPQARVRGRDPAGGPRRSLGGWVRRRGRDHARERIGAPPPRPRRAQAAAARDLRRLRHPWLPRLPVRKRTISPMETTEDRGPGVLIFPPVLFALTLATGAVLQWFFPLPFWQATWSRRILGALLFLAALAF